MNNWDTKVNATPVWKKAKECGDCHSTGIEVTEINTIVGDTIAVAHDCVSCKGTGVIILHYKECKCGTSNWMEEDCTMCKKCFNKEMDEFIAISMKDMYPTQ